MTNNKHKQYWLLLVLLSAFILSACDRDRHISDLRKYVTELKQSLVKDKAKVATTDVKTPAPITYQTKTERSPFESKVEANPANTSSNPLAGYPLSVLRFKGTVTIDNQIWAFILAPDSKLYQVKIDDVIGDRYGKITHIYPDKVEVQEKIQGETSQNANRIVTLPLKE